MIGHGRRGGNEQTEKEKKQSVSWPLSRSVRSAQSHCDRPHWTDTWQTTHLHTQANRSAKFRMQSARQAQQVMRAATSTATVAASQTSGSISRRGAFVIARCSLLTAANATSASARRTLVAGSALRLATPASSALQSRRSVATNAAAAAAAETAELAAKWHVPGSLQPTPQHAHVSQEEKKVELRRQRRVAARVLLRRS